MAMLAALMLTALLPAEMYDLVLPAKASPAACVHGCARWRALAADGSRQLQGAADAMWKEAPPPGDGGRGRTAAISQRHVLWWQTPYAKLCRRGNSRHEA
jgi:hypothetical protein